MPVFQIVRCCEDSCRLFQVQQKKKAQKWTCVVCGTKQSLKQVFFEAEAAAECRRVVQELNLKSPPQVACLSNDLETSVPARTSNFNSEEGVAKTSAHSKWSKYNYTIEE